MELGIIGFKDASIYSSIKSWNFDWKRVCFHIETLISAPVVELADTLDLGSSAERRGGSTPSWSTNLTNFVILQVCRMVFYKKIQYFHFSTKGPMR